MKRQEHEQFARFVEKKSKELTSQEDIIRFFQQVGYYDDDGNVAYPYTSRKK